MIIKNFLLISLMVLFIFSSNAQASVYRFCAAQTEHQGVLCSEITSGSTFTNWRACRNWAIAQNVTYKGFYLDTDEHRLEFKQSLICDILPAKTKWSCFVIEDCGMTSSVGPINVNIFSPSGDVELARDKCVNAGWIVYKERLINLNHGCKMAPDAVELAD